jgi:hypothetical protein
MNSFNDTAVQQSSSAFSFKAFIAAIFQLRLRDKLSASNRDDGGVTWGL